MEVHRRPTRARKLHLGCGRHILDGYLNLDAKKSPKALGPPDVIWEDLKNLPFDDGAFDEVLAVHLFEHIWLSDVPETLLEWRRVLAPNGRLVLELPDLIKCCRNVLSGGSEKQGLWGLYGGRDTHDSVLDVHKWGWSFATLCAALSDAGFAAIREETPQWHRRDRDMRLVAIK